MITFEHLLELDAAIDAASADWKLANDGGDSEGMERAGRASSIASARLDRAIEATTPAVRARWTEHQRQIDIAHGGPFTI